MSLLLALESASGSIDGTLSAGVAVGASAVGTLTLAGALAAGVAVGASASGTLAVSGIASSSVAVGAAGVSTLTLAGAVASSVAVGSSASGSLSLSGVALPGLAIGAYAPGTLTLDGACAPSMPVGCEATGSLAFSIPVGARTGLVSALTLTTAPAVATATVAITALTRTEALPVSISYAKRLDDTLPAFAATLTLNGAAYDLNAPANGVASASLHYRLRGGSGWTARVMTIDPVTTGLVSYAWGVGEPADAGVYEYAVQITYLSGDKLSFPNGTTLATFLVTEATS